MNPLKTKDNEFFIGEISRVDIYNVVEAFFLDRCNWSLQNTEPDSLPETGIVSGLAGPARGRGERGPQALPDRAGASQLFLVCSRVFIYANRCIIAIPARIHDRAAATPPRLRGVSP